MRIALTAMKAEPGAVVDPRLGRAQYIMIYDTEKAAWEVLDNQENVMAQGGAGVAVADMLVRNGVNIVLTGACGPKAAKALSAANIPVREGTSGIVEDALQAFLSAKEADR